MGIYRDRAHVERGIDELLNGGFRREDVSVLMHDSEAPEYGLEKHTKAPEGATTGASAGVVIGGAVGLLAGIGQIAAPQLGPLVAAGPILGALAGAGAAGVAGGIIGALAGLGFPEYEARKHAGLIAKGHILLSVHCDEPGSVERAQGIMARSGAQDISTMGRAGAEFSHTSEPRVHYGGTAS
jgi:hypothetical protein